MDPQTTAGLARGFSQAGPSPHARLGGEQRAQVRVRCLKPLCLPPAASAGAARPGWRVPGAPLAGAVRPSGGEPRAPQVRDRPGGTDAGSRPLPFASPGPGRGARGEELKAAPEGEERPLMHDLTGVVSRVCPPALCRSGSRLRTPRNLRAGRQRDRGAPRGGEAPAGGAAFSGTRGEPLAAGDLPPRHGRRRSGPSTEQEAKPSGPELGGSGAGAGSPSAPRRALRRREAGSPPAPFAGRGRPAAPYNLIFPRARRSIAAHLLHSAAPRAGGGGEKGGPGEPPAQVLGFPWAVPALQLAALAPRPERPTEGGL